MLFDLSPVIRQRFFTSSGVLAPLSGGKLYSYIAGTTTPLATYVDSTGITPNANPVILDSSGYANIWMSQSNYKFVLTDSLDNVLWTVDNVKSIQQIVADQINLNGALAASNNLSDVLNKATSYNNISPLTTLGDVPYGGTAGAGTRLAGNTTSTKNYLVQTGTGSASAAPAWGTIAAIDVPTLNQSTTGTASNITGLLLNANLATMATNTIKSNITGSSASPLDNSLSAIIDSSISNTRGSVLYRGASLWSALAPSTSGFFLKTNGAGADPTWGAAGGAAAYLAPTVQKFLSSSGTYGLTYYFTVTSANATVGATYTNNGNTFTVVNTIAAATTLICTSNGAPTASGTLTKSGGTGDATIAFASKQAPLYLRVQLAGGGGGGSGASAGGGSLTAGGTGGTTTFGSSLLTATGGVGGQLVGGSLPDSGGSGGSATIASPAIGKALVGTNGGGAVGVQTGNNRLAGGYGGASPIFGGSGTGANYISVGVSGLTNTGGGGQGGSTNATGGGVSGSGGGSGGAIDAIIPSPSATYSFAVGAAGAVGTAGTGGTDGGAGGSGIIVVEEFYQ